MNCRVREIAQKIKTPISYYDTSRSHLLRNASLDLDQFIRLDKMHKQAMNKRDQVPF